jgi:hypothetical protein
MRIASHTWTQDEVTLCTEEEEEEEEEEEGLDLRIETRKRVQTNRISNFCVFVFQLDDEILDDEILRFFLFFFLFLFS